MKKQARVSIKEPVKPTKEVKADLSKGIYKGEIRSIVGQHRLLVRASGKESFIYVDKSGVEAIKEKYGKDFIRNCGVVKKDHKPQFK
ncbi:hypothetical protein [Dyadobacter helix]|nr:hypothetical protein [Dyadobacter sp. CECT 9275]